MKKLISMLLVLVMAVSVFAGCSGKKDTASAPASALEILENTWALYAQEEKFSVMGGNEFVMDAPGAYSMDAASDLPYVLYIPEEDLTKIDDAATMVHGMMANNFTSGALHVAEGNDAKTFANTMVEALKNAQFMCGFPEYMLVAVVGEYVVVAFGLENDDAKLISTFKNYLTTAYADADVVAFESML